MTSATTDIDFSDSQYLDMDLLRFTTAGSVDDGKSTLIGRLLYDSKSIFEDQWDTLERGSAQRGDDRVNLALLTDGLRAEREQGITIDVAYKYFATPQRKFIIADTPGHVQYTRNMVTGASTSNLTIVLVDARNGLVEQSYRHAYIASLLQVHHLVLCVNKMDLVDYDRKVFDRIQRTFDDFAAKLDIPEIHYIPISALAGDNVVVKSDNMPWYQGPTLLHILENVHIASDYNHIDGRFPVQGIIRPQTDDLHDYRGYMGRIEGGIFRPGDEIVAQPSGFTSRIKSIDTLDGLQNEAFAPMSVSITLEDDIDISRGDMLVKPNNLPTISQDVDVMICWFNQKPLTLGGKYLLRHTTKEVRGVVKEIAYKLDINTLKRIEDDKNIAMNDIAKIKLRVSSPLMVDSYRKNRSTGSLILIDEFTYETVGAGMVA
jgi:sulfate adenylyltransferase subunit 1